MFIEVTDKIKDSLEDPLDRIFRNDYTPEGMFENAQFLRYRHKTGTWEIEIRSGFSKFKVMLQEFQAMAIINNELGHDFTLQVSKYDRDALYV